MNIIFYLVPFMTMSSIGNFPSLQVDPKAGLVGLFSGFLFPKWSAFLMISHKYVSFGIGALLNVDICQTISPNVSNRSLPIIWNVFLTFANKLEKWGKNRSSSKEKKIWVLKVVYCWIELGGTTWFATQKKKKINCFELNDHPLRWRMRDCREWSGYCIAGLFL